MGQFWRHFFEKFHIDLVGAKIVLRKGACNIELNFAPKAQNLTNQDCAEGAIFLEPRLESAVLDAVLEDKPAQPLPCGSYLVSLLQDRTLKFVLEILVFAHFVKKKRNSKGTVVSSY